MKTSKHILIAEAKALLTREGYIVTENEREVVFEVIKNATGKATEIHDARYTFTRVDASYGYLGSIKIKDFGYDNNLIQLFPKCFYVGCKEISINEPLMEFIDKVREIINSELN